MEVYLNGFDLLGGSVNFVTGTDHTGRFEFAEIPAGTYTLTEAQLSSYLDGIDTVGSYGGTQQAWDPFSGLDTVSGLVIGAGTEGSGYFFGELPSAGGAA